MKNRCLLFIILFNIITNNYFSQQQRIINKNKLSNTWQKQKIEKIELKEQTRGTNRLITFTPNSKITSLNGDITTSSLSTDEWRKITEQVSLIELSKVDTFSSSTTDRYSDKALASTITFFVDGKEYTSSTFDAGAPPKELKSLYDLLMGNTKNQKKTND